MLPHGATKKKRRVTRFVRMSNGVGGVAESGGWNWGLVLLFLLWEIHDFCGEESRRRLSLMIKTLGTSTKKNEKKKRFARFWRQRLCRRCIRLCNLAISPLEKKVVACPSCQTQQSGEWVRCVRLGSLECCCACAFSSFYPYCWVNKLRERFFFENKKPNLTTARVSRDSLGVEPTKK